MKTCNIVLLLLATSTLAAAADFGGHVGYFGADVRKADIGANVVLPIGMVAIAPNIDYTRMANSGLWFGNADVALRFGTPATSYWVGAGPTYGYVSNYSSSATTGYGQRSIRGQQYNPPPATPPGTPPTTTPSTPGGRTASARFGGSTSAWGWDANAGVSWAASSLRPYVVARYNQVHSLKTAGVALGLRFGH